MLTIEIAKDFSTEPGGRFLTDGPASGQRFRDEMLSPALSEGEHVLVVLDGVEGYGSSFLEEAFGGLVRLGHSKAALHDRLHLKSDDQSYVDEIWSYIDDPQNV